jgi:precorrin-6B C5,15-methyltransferase / cobalt-precorrin-6B C5,C15-methyltransferase
MVKISHRRVGVMREMKPKIHIIGMGPGNAEYIHPAAQRILEASDVLIGGKRNLEAVEELNREKLVIGNNLEEISSYIAKHAGNRRIAVLVSGDPGIYSILGFLKARLEGVDIEVLPGISSLQYLCSRLQLNWNDMRIVSVHGRQEDNLTEIVRKHPKVAIFTGGEQTPGRICASLLEKGIRDACVAVGENLSYPEERIVQGTLEELKEMTFDSLSIMVIHAGKMETAVRKAWEYQTPGIPDDMFLRGNVPMTKEEVRAVSLAKLRLSRDSVVYDIGAGTGSVAVECGLICTCGRICAIERNPEAVALIEQNIRKFGLENVIISAGDAPEALIGLPRPDRVFIGGTGGNMEAILGWIVGQCGSIRVVANAVTIESAYEAVKGMEALGFDNVEIVNVAITRSRKAGDKHLMQAVNPVYVISGERNG